MLSDHTQLKVFYIIVDGGHLCHFLEVDVREGLSRETDDDTCVARRTLTRRKRYVISSWHL